MGNKLIIEKAIRVTMPASTIWEALVNPKLVKLYMFGCDVISKWKVGSSIVFKLADQVLLQGIILEIEPEKLLRYTVFDPTMGIPDIPANYLYVTYELFSEKEYTTLAISQGNFSCVENGEHRYLHSIRGWDSTLIKMRQVIDSIAV